ncbi:hypothetical protein DLM46_31145 [Paraburkholderia lacunae]|uniref:Uncharacterized protein n=1 Tax=Paraburkholderia lacunae TaxID=2211104 RepID=A0A370MZU0_9BURK|nr:hypothetical protein DLM46_31145 [Paraburkholderia lacunae]
MNIGYAPIPRDCLRGRIAQANRGMAAVPGRRRAKFRRLRLLLGGIWIAFTTTTVTTLNGRISYIS